MYPNIRAIEDYVRKLFKNKNLMVRPQNIHKNSRPARLCRQYDIDPEDLLWILDTSDGYPNFYGFLFRVQKYPKAFADWIRTRMKRAKKIIKGKQYILVADKKIPEKTLFDEID